MLYPTMLDTLGDQLSPTVCCFVATPAPDAVNTPGEFLALPVTENCVEVEPLLVGLKLIPNEMLFPAAIVAGKVAPLSVNS